MKTIKLLCCIYLFLNVSCAILDTSIGYTSNIFPSAGNEAKWSGIDVKLSPTKTKAVMLPFLLYARITEPYVTQMVIQDTNMIPSFVKVSISNVILKNETGTFYKELKCNKFNFEEIKRNANGGSWFRHVFPETLSINDNKIEAIYSVKLIKSNGDTISEIDTITLKKTKFRNYTSF
jgi:hypothetical protein